jgi:hypothetical protein
MNHILSGENSRQKEKVFNALFQLQQIPENFTTPTSAELAAIAGLDRFMVARRLPDLRRDGRVENVTLDDGRLFRRQCAIKKTSAVVWRVKQ